MENNSNLPRDGKIDIGTLAIISPFVLILLLLVKAYGVARFSLTTATALVTAAPISVLLGTLALYEYAFMATTAAVALLLSIAWSLDLQPRSDEPRRYHPMRRWVPATLILMIFSAALSPPLYLAWASSVLLVVLAIVFIWNRFEHRMISISKISIYAAIAALAIFFIATLDRVWLPAEVITLNKPISIDMQHASLISRHPVAFVISDENGWATILISQDHYLAWVRDSDVESRTICHLEDQLVSGRTLYQIILGQKYKSPNIGCVRWNNYLTQKDRSTARTTKFPLRPRAVEINQSA
jgi:hypothetical protein